MIKLKCRKMWYKKILQFLPTNTQITEFEVDKQFYDIGCDIQYDFNKLYLFLKDKVTFTYNPDMGTIQI
jgi:hypothetical protein